MLMPMLFLEARMCPIRFRPARALSWSLACALALAAALPAGVRAQDKDSDDHEPLFRAGVAGGLSLPMSTTRQALGQGVQGQALVLLRLSTGFLLRVDGSYQRFDFKPAFGSGGTSQTLGGIAGVQVYLSGGPVRPYFTGGLGAFQVRASQPGGPAATSPVRLGIAGGAGFTLELGRVSAFVEGDVQNIFTDHRPIDTRSIESLPISFGLMIP